MPSRTLAEAFAPPNVTVPAAAGATVAVSVTAAPSAEVPDGETASVVTVGVATGAGAAS